MKTLLLLAFCGAGLYCIGLTGSRGKNSIPVSTAYNPLDSLVFITQVEPILQQNCSPCHFPKGKVYAKMPFDVPGTIFLLKKDRVLMRIKDENQKDLVRKYLNQN